MKKEDVMSLVVYALMILIAILVGLFAINRMFVDYMTTLNSGQKIGITLGLVVFSIIFNEILFELGHVIGAKIGHYGIISINVLGLSLYKNQGKLKFKFSNFDGLAGETKIGPKDEKSNPKMFALMPLILYGLEALICIILFVVFQNIIANGNSSVKSSFGLGCIILIMLITIGGMLELYQIFPAKLDCQNDGYILSIVSEKNNLPAYNELLKIEYNLSCNNEIGECKIFTEITDFTSQVNLYSVYKYLDEDKNKEAEEILDKIIENKNLINIHTYCSALASKMYILLMSKSYNEVKPYYDKYVTTVERRIISNTVEMEFIRSYILISSILDISEQETRYAISKYHKAMKLLEPGRVKIEKKLYDKALDKVNEIRPEWHIKEKEIN